MSEHHCDHPDCQGSVQREEIAEKIKQYGQTVIAVYGSGETPGFVYTIGRYEQGQHELLMPVMDNADLKESGRMLNAMQGCDIKSDERVRVGDQVFYAMEIPGSGAFRDTLTQANHYYGFPIQAVVLIPEALVQTEETVTQ